MLPQLLHLLCREEDEQEDDLPPPPKSLNHLKPALTGTRQDLKLDQSSGRVGDPPGLSPGSGSSQHSEVKVQEMNDKVDESLYPPMNLEELEQLDLMMLDAGKVLTEQSEEQQEKGDQAEPHLQQVPQDQDLFSQQQHKWELPAGRVGDPPGLDLGLGSSQQQQVECNDSSMKDSNPDCFPPMALEAIQWYDDKMMELQGAPTGY